MDLISQVQSSGVVGAGGAGFPTHVKLNAQAEYLIINAAECEPLLQTDQYLMRERAIELAGGILLAKKQIQASKAVIAVKGKYSSAINAMNVAISELNADIEIFELQNFYPAGDEQMTVYEVTGRSVPPGGIPLNVGCVVSNVATMINVFEAMQDIPVTHKYVSILGDVHNPRVIRIPVGSSLLECLNAAGGTTRDDFAIIRGGPMMGKIIHCEEVASTYLSKTDGALIIIPKDHYLIKRASLTEDQIIRRAKSCIQCGQCTELCPRFLIGHDLRPHKMMRVIKENREFDKSCAEAQLCCGCGVCEMYACPMGIDPRQVNFIIANKLREKGIRYQHDGSEIIAREHREQRKVPANRLISRLDLTQWDRQVMGEFADVKVNRVCIAMSQHIGAPATPCTTVGERVSAGQVIGHIPNGKLGSTIHASINGVVTTVDSNQIIISGEHS